MSKNAKNVHVVMCKSFTHTKIRTPEPIMMWQEVIVFIPPGTARIFHEISRKYMQCIQIFLAVQIDVRSGYTSINVSAIRSLKVKISTFRRK